jgi:NitT/TauT family transport system permease protein
MNAGTKSTGIKTIRVKKTRSTGHSRVDGVEARVFSPHAGYAGQVEEPARPAWAWQSMLLRVGAGLASTALLVAVWWVVAVVGNYPDFILPAPPVVAAVAWQMLTGDSPYGSLLLHAWVTMREAGLGFLVALLVGLTLGYLIAHSHFLERLISPYIAVSQGLPVVAIAPLLFIWIGDDLTRKVVIVALIAFFPMLVNTIVGLRGIDRAMLEVAVISGANLWQTIWYVELPLSMGALLGGTKLGLTLSITGAVVGEIIAPQFGLGSLLMLGRGTFNTALVFVGLVSLAALTVLVYSAVSLLERLLITWQD